MIRRNSQRVNEQEILKHNKTKITLRLSSSTSSSSSSSDYHQGEENSSLLESQSRERSHYSHNYSDSETGNEDRVKGYIGPSSENLLEKLSQKRPVKAFVPQFTSNSKLGGECQLLGFKIGKLLCKGGFGSVSAATHIQTNTTVVLKKIAAKTVRTMPEYVHREELIHHELKSPYVTRPYCTIKLPSDDVYFVMEYVPGGDLHERIFTDNEIFTVERITKIAAQLLLALHEMHSKCIAHRDIKPANILLDEKDNVKLIDFGLAKVDCDDNTAEFAGTLDWVAPEVLIADKKHKWGRAADYYSLAMLLYSVAMGELPIDVPEEMTPSQVYEEMKCMNFKLPSIGNAALDELISLLTIPDQKKRYEAAFHQADEIKKLEIFKSFKVAAAALICQIFWTSIKHR